VDGQNDNDWNQGLLFLNQSQVWLQPPGYVTQMFSRHYQPRLVQCLVTDAVNVLDACATRSNDGKVLVVQVVNPTEKTVPTQIHLNGFSPRNEKLQLTELVAPLSAKNTAVQTKAITSQTRALSHGFDKGNISYAFPPYSVTLMRLE
jgi:alpha-L-arabinofuranosidase